MNTTNTIKAGDVAHVIAAPGYPTGMHVIITEIKGRTLIAQHLSGPQTYTLRRNGKWAAKGSPQWNDYLEVK